MSVHRADERPAARLRMNLLSRTACTQPCSYFSHSGTCSTRAQGEFVFFGGLICELLVEVTEVGEVVEVVAVVEDVAAFLAAVIWHPRLEFQLNISVPP